MNESTEQEYYAASSEADQALRKLEPQQVVNLLQQYLVGVFDVGILEGMSEEQASGVTLWLKDLVACIPHLDLSVGCEPQEWPSWDSSAGDEA